VGRGYLDNLWLTKVEQRGGGSIIGYWRSLLARRSEQFPFDLHILVDSLIRQCPNGWVDHLRDTAPYLTSNTEIEFHPYSLQEVKGVLNIMTESSNTPLSKMLERKAGTLRFGHALRQLGRSNNGPLRDLVDDLDAVRTTDQLLRILAVGAQECAVARGKSDFIIVPNDEDLRFLLDDVDQYGPRTVAGLLVILSTLRYPRVDKADDTPNEN
jgi:hypothetical protein